MSKQLVQLSPPKPAQPDQRASQWPPQVGASDRPAADRVHEQPASAAKWNGGGCFISAID